MCEVLVTNWAILKVILMIAGFVLGLIAPHMIIWGIIEDKFNNTIGIVIGAFLSIVFFSTWLSFLIVYVFKA